MPNIQTGLDQLFSKYLSKLKGKRIGLLIHAASVNLKLIHALDLFLDKPGLNVTRLFGPEHGLWATAQDMVEVGQGKDSRSNLPVTSLYGNTFESLKPTPKSLSDIDILIADLQDIGARYYTYAATLAQCMKACAETGKEVMVLDRPNPINGVDIEGPLLKKGYESFVGLYPIPVRHGMTMGELALYFNQEENIGCSLQVIKMKSWKRKMFFDETKLPWVPPSPNMPTLNTALVYPGMGLMEATHLSEGRGTTLPFEWVGAPFINPYDLQIKLNELKLPGVFFRPLFFQPTYHKWADESCGGVQVHITNRKKIRPFLTGVAVLKIIYDLYPDAFQWRDKPYEFVSDIPAIDLLSGGNTLLLMLEQNKSWKAIQTFCREKNNFIQKRKKYLLY